MKSFQNSCIRETLNLLTDADSSTNIFVSAGFQKGADGIFFFFQKSTPHAAVVAIAASQEAFEQQKNENENGRVWPIGGPEGDLLGHRSGLHI